MTRYVTIHSVLAPVDARILGRAEHLVVIGDKSCEIDAGGVSERRVDEQGNLMGAIAILWHDKPVACHPAVDDFIRDFSPAPFGVRKETVEDPHRNDRSDCGRYFQSDDGTFVFHEGFLLVAPDQEALEEFFRWGLDCVAP